MKDKESGYPLSFILTEWEYAGGTGVGVGLYGLRRVTFFFGERK